MAIERALISVSDKTGIVEFARELAELGVEILSTGGTFKLLTESNVPAREVADYTGFPEMMDGRVKTLHPKIHGGILARRGTDEEAMASQGIQRIDMVVVNLYPFEATVAKDDCTLPMAIENIDIGGPTMVRAAAKNHKDVTIVVEPDDYIRVIDELRDRKEVSQETRFELAAKAFSHTANYDGAISNYLTSIDTATSEKQAFPTSFTQQFSKLQDMRYGENPHQQAAFYAEHNADPSSIAGARQLQGKELSYNNIADTDAALECVKSFEAPACVIVKHANPCGVAVAATIGEAYERAFATDPTSSFGGIIAFNKPLDAATAKLIVDRQFVEVIIAPGVDGAAVAIIAAKKNVRLLVVEPWQGVGSAEGWDYKRVCGGLLIQDRDTGAIAANELQSVTKRKPSEQELSDLLFCWQVAKYVKSNAIVYARDGQTIGIGAGQMSRVYSAKIAGIKAADEGLVVPGSVMASDAFFPFRDGLDAAAEAGIRAVIQPGGSIRDEEVIAAADEADIAMVFTGMRHFRH